MPGYGEIDDYGSLDYKQDLASNFLIVNKINAITGVCLGYAVNPNQGQGYSFLKNSAVPTAWIWPEPQAAALEIFDFENQQRYIILDEITGRWYEIGTREGPDNSGLNAVYQDKAGGQYAGVEIPCALKLREHIGGAEHKRKEHVETHAYLRPQREENKGASGYTADGFRLAQEFEIRAYIAGRMIEHARTKNIPLNGDFVFDRKTDDHRVQIGFNSTASEFRLAGMDQYYLEKDESATTKVMTEHNWQVEFNTPVLWVTRGPSPMIDRATGLTGTGDYFSEIIGPDGKEDSALSFSPVDGIVFGERSVSGDFSFIFSVSNLALPCAVYGPIDIYEQDGTTYLRIRAGGEEHSHHITLNGWDTFLIKRVGDNIVFGQNGNILSTYPNRLPNSITEDIDIMNGQEGEGFNYWIFDNAISDGGWEYFYKDLTENAGGALLPIW